MSDAPQTPQHFESQKERWVKYGANVAIASVIVFLLAGVVVYLAQKTGRRIDTTPSTLLILAASGYTGATSLVFLGWAIAGGGGAGKPPITPPITPPVPEALPAAG